MNDSLMTIVPGLALFAGMLICTDLGYRLGSRRMKRNPEVARANAGAIEATIFGLLGLVLAFTISGAASRLDARRQLVVGEANAIGTAYLRLDLLPASEQPALRSMFRQYLDARLRTYEKIADLAAAEPELAETARLQGEIWLHAQTACRGESSNKASLLLLPAINAMIDITTARTMAAKTHIPIAIVALLFAMALLSAMLVGDAMAGPAKRNLPYMCAYAAAIAMTVQVILDLDYPRVGFIRLDPADQVLRDLRDTM